MSMTPNDLFRLDGKVALVTGGSSGIGEMAAEGLVAAGARVLIASRKGEACVAVAEKLNAMGYDGTAEGFAGDVSTEAGIDALVAEVEARTTKLDILMNNAGRTWGAALGEHPYEAWDKLFTLNVQGAFHLTQQLLPLLRAAAKPQVDPARVVFTGSVMGETPRGTNVYSYAASKAAIHQVTRTLSNDLAWQGINVNAIAPGPFLSKMMAFAIGHEEGRKAAAAGVPVGRVGEPGDIAGVMQFLCGRGGAYVTGAIIPVSGGMQSMAEKPAFVGGD